MALTQTQKRRALFIKRMIDAVTPQDEIKVYKSLYPNCKSDRVAQKNCSRLLQNADIWDPIVAGRAEREAIAAAARKEEIQRVAREEVVSQTELEAMLSKIALGKFRRKRTVAAFDTKTGKLLKAEIEDSVSGTDMISAADKLLRVKGAYAPEKFEHDASDKFVEMMRGVAMAHKSKKS